MTNVSLRDLHPGILWCSIALLLIGEVMVTSASLHVAAVNTGEPFHFSLHQAIYLLLGLVVGAFVYFFVDLEWLRKLRFLALLGGLGALVVVLLPGLGVEVNGSRRWIGVGGLTLQASEVTKLCFIVYLAGYIDKHQADLQHNWQAIVPPLVVLVAMSILLLCEPNFGAAVVLGICTLGMLMMAGVPFRYFAIMAFGVLLVGGIVAVAEPYRVERLVSFIHPWEDRFGSGYQLTQSLIAFGRGHWFGVGLGEGVQKLFYLPEAHTDFVFSVLGEELGLAGVLAVVALFSGLGYSLLRLGRHLQTRGMRYHAQLVFGISLIICAQAFINMGVTMGVLPTKGLTLPFVSYGGSSMVIMEVMVALALRAAAESNRLQQQGRTQ